MFTATALSFERNLLKSRLLCYFIDFTEMTCALGFLLLLLLLLLVFFNIVLNNRRVTTAELEQSGNIAMSLRSRRRNYSSINTDSAAETGLLLRALL